MSRSIYGTDDSYTYGRMRMIDNYMYMYHTQTLIVLPTYPEQIQDSMGANFAQTTPLARSAPIFSYQNSGPRSINVSLKLQRELMTQVNWRVSNASVAMGDDYVDTMIKQMRAAVMPKYSASSKMVDPPIIAVRFGDDIFCKGVINGSISISYDLPIIEDREGKSKYSIVNVAFPMVEVDPYEAESVMVLGGYRGLSTTLERNIWTISKGGNGGGALGKPTTYKPFGP